METGTSGGKVWHMRVLVTGGAGFIGSHFVRSLVGGRYPGFPRARVTVLDKLTYAGNRASLEPLLSSGRVELVVGDILDRGLVDTLMAATDLVVHFAAESHVDRSIAGAADFAVTNVVGTQSLLDSACGPARRICASSMCPPTRYTVRSRPVPGPRPPCWSRTRPTRRARPEVI